MYRPGETTWENTGDVMARGDHRVCTLLIKWSKGDAKTSVASLCATALRPQGMHWSGETTWVCIGQGDHWVCTGQGRPQGRALGMHCVSLVTSMCSNIILLTSNNTY